MNDQGIPFGRSLVWRYNPKPFKEEKNMRTRIVCVVLMAVLCVGMVSATVAILY